MNNARRFALWLLTLLLASGFAWLGYWQLARADEKQRMLEAAAAGQDRTRPTDLGAASGSADYTWAAGSGRFLQAPLLLLDNQRRGNQVGVSVLAIFQPVVGRPLLVDMGWLPLPGDRRLPEVAPPTGEQHIAGLLGPAPGAGIAMGPAYVEHDPQRWMLTRVDIPALAAQLRVPLSAHVLRLDPALPIGYTRDLQVLRNTLLPERHRGYAVQWFGLALATLITALFLGFRRPRQ